MAVFNVTLENMPVRFDTGSPFGGVTERLGVDSSAVLKIYPYFSNGAQALYLTNSAYGTGDDYRLVWLGNIEIKARWDGDPSNDAGFQDLGNRFDTLTGESATSDYKLDWAKSQFASIALQVPSYNAELIIDPYDRDRQEWSSWTTIRELATTNSYLDLPFRANENDKDWVAKKRSEFENSPQYDVPIGQGLFENAFEYQSVVYNWEYPFETPLAQYLFGNDRINGGRSDDVLRGYAGDDSVRGYAGDDLLYADYGRDRLFGGPGNDVLVFSGSSSSWDVSKFEYRSSAPELAVGGSGSDFFVFRPSEINWTTRADVYYDMHLPNLYSGKFKYKTVNYSEIDPDPITGQSPYRVNDKGDIVTGDGDKIVVQKAAFSANNNPFQKLQPIEVFEMPGTVGTGASQRNVWNAVTKDTDGNDIVIGEINESNYDFNYDYEFFVDEKGGVWKLPIPFDPATPQQDNPTLVKSGVFKTNNTPFEKSQGLSLYVNENGDIMANGILRKPIFNYFENNVPAQNAFPYISEPLESEIFIKSGDIVFLDERAGNHSYDSAVPELDNEMWGDDAVYFRAKNDSWYYNPFMTQNQNDAYITGEQGSSRAKSDAGNGVSHLTQRVRVQDFKIGSDKLDLSAFGLTNEIMATESKKLDGQAGASYLKALSGLLKGEGLEITSAKTAWTSGNTSLFIKEANSDANGNGTKDDTLLEIQLVGINISSVNGRFFGEIPSQIEADMMPGFLTY